MASKRSTPRFNPRGGDRRGPGKAGSRPSPSLWYGLGLLLLLGLAQVYWLAPAGRTLPYSEFKTLLKNGEVAEVAVSGQTIHGTLKNETDKTKGFTTTRVDDPKLTEELEAKGVKYAGEQDNHWLPDLLGWIVPLLFFVGIWGFFFRRMSGAEGGVMSFARSRAKIYADERSRCGSRTWPAWTRRARSEGDRRVPEDAEKYTNPADGFPKACRWSALAPARRCSRAVAGEAHVPFSLADRNSSRCSSASAPRASAISSSRLRPRRRASSSSTS